MSGVAVVFGGLVLVGAAGLALWFLTHPAARGPVRGPGAAWIGSERRSRRRGVMIVGLLLVAAAFFLGVTLLPAGGRSRAGAVLYVTYWTIVLLLALALMILALVDMWLLRRSRSRDRMNALLNARRRKKAGGRSGKGKGRSGASSS